MRMSRMFFGAVALAAVSAVAIAPAIAQTGQAESPAENAKAAGQFIDQLADQAFSVLLDKKNDRAEVRDKFRTLLKQHFAIDEIGNKLIRRHVGSISKVQYQAYTSAFPDYVIDTYSDNLFDFADSDLKIVRNVPRGTRGNVDVYTRVIRNDGAQPIDAIWSVKRENGKFLVTNLTVAGVNLTLTQEADFNAYIQKNGFNALVEFMRNKKTA